LLIHNLIKSPSPAVAGGVKVKGPVANIRLLVLVTNVMFAAYATVEKGVEVKAMAPDVGGVVNVTAIPVEGGDSVTEPEEVPFMVNWPILISLNYC